MSFLPKIAGTVAGAALGGPIGGLAAGTALGLVGGKKKKTNADLPVNPNAPGAIAQQAAALSNGSAYGRGSSSLSL